MSRMIHSVSSCYNCWMHVWHKHSDLVSSTGILAVTTCLLAAKIFPRIPAILPRLSLVILNFTGVIWLNIQVREIKKSAADLQLALKIKDLSGATLTAAKVMVKGINALLTCGLFAASVVAFCGFPQTTAIMYLGMRPFAIFSLATGIFCEDRKSVV